MGKKPIAIGYSSQIDGSGELLTYPDVYKNVTQEDVKDAIDIEKTIIHVKSLIERGYYAIAKALDEFERRRLYLARGFDTFSAWCESDDVDIGYRLAHDMLRIVREAVPALGDGVDLDAYGISKARALLPLLADENGKEKLQQAFEDTAQLTVKDTNQYVKEIRGIAKPIDEDPPAIFSGTLQRGESYHKLIIRRNGANPYSCGTLTIRVEDWPRWEERFGGFVFTKGEGSSSV